MVWRLARDRQVVGLWLCITAALNIDRIAAAVTGQAYLTVERYPLPSDSYKAFAHGTNLAWGPDILTNRIAWEKALYIATQEVMETPAEIALRLVNYTDHPSQTPGLERYSSREYSYISYAPYDIPFEYTWGAKPFFTNSLEASQHPVWRRVFKQDANLTAGLMLTSVHFMNSRYVDGTTLPVQAKATDAADVLSSIQITGKGVLPFVFDKQTILLSSLFDANSLEGLPMSYMHFPDFLDPTGTNDDINTKQPKVRKLLSEIRTCGTHGKRHHRRQLHSTPAGTPSGNASDSSQQSVVIDIYTRVLPVPNMAVATLWARLAPRLAELTEKAGLKMDVVFKNATVKTLIRGQADPVVSKDFLPADYVAKNPVYNNPGGLDSLGGKHLARGTTAAIVVAAVLLALLMATLVVGLCTWKSRPGKITYPIDPEESMQLKGTNGKRRSLDTFVKYYDEIPEEEISLDRDENGKLYLLGEGAYGSVYAATWRGCPVAVKQLIQASDCHAMASLHKETDILKRVSKNKNVVQFYGISGTRIITELMEGGNLRQALRSNKEEYEWERQGKVVTLDIARGLTFLHGSGVIHRDIKASNILLSQEGVAKIADVGLATTANLFTAGTTQGTWAYAAPELLVASMETRCSCAVDMYSFGVLLWEIVTRETPVRGGLHAVAQELCPPAVHRLLETCITEDVDARPTAATVVKVLEAL